MANAKPIIQIRLGAIRASIWANDTASGRRYNVTVGRLYQKDGAWKTSNSFGQDEVLVLCKALDMAYLWIAEAKGANKNEPPAANVDESGCESLDEMAPDDDELPM